MNRLPGLVGLPGQVVLSRHSNVYPIVHVQFVTTVLRLGEVEPLGHARQFSTVVAPAVAEYVPVPQSVHVAESVAPAVGEYVPAEQVVHGAEPVALL